MTVKANCQADRRRPRPDGRRSTARCARTSTAWPRWPRGSRTRRWATEDCAEACAIEAFFSGSMREHHLIEESGVFPALLASDDAELVTRVRTLMHDHGWIEQTWLEIAPQLRAVAQGHHWIDPAEFLHGAEVFLELCYGHAALEETVVPARTPGAPADTPAVQVAGAAP